MRIAFMGSPDFAIPALLALHTAGHDVAAVYSQPPRPAGRGYTTRLSPVHAAAERLGLEVRTPARLRGDAAALQAFASLHLDLAVVAAYGLILPPPILAAPRQGCINIHASLLPRWRGASPIQAAILAGDPVTGVTIMRMEAGLDTGPLLHAGSVAIPARATAAMMHDVLAELGARLIVSALNEMPRAIPQIEADATWAPKLSRDDGRIDWSRDAAALDRQVRAYDPWPGCFSTLGGTTLKILSAEPAVGQGPPGMVLDERLLIACGQGALRLTRVQLSGRSPLDAPSFLRGHPVTAGTRLG